MIMLRTPKGWTGPKEVDGLKTEGFWRSHQVPFAEMRQARTTQAARRVDEELSAGGTVRRRVLCGQISPPWRRRRRRMSANPHANGGLLMRQLDLPDIADYAVEVRTRRFDAEATAIMAEFLRDVMRRTRSRNFRIFGPDETAQTAFACVRSDRPRLGRGTLALRRSSRADGRVMEILSEHTCQGWLEGYLLTGRHGLFACYEAFIHIVDSMFNQHAKWLKSCARFPWRRPIPSLNYLLTSHVWHQDHNGFSHQDPGFIDYVCNKKADIVRVYLPPDANTLLSSPTMPAQLEPHQRHRRWQTAGAAMAQHG